MKKRNSNLKEIKMIGFNKVKFFKATILVLLVVLISSVVTVNLAAQEVSPSSGSRTITTYVLANTNSLGGGSLRVQVQYIVRWRAGICQEEYQSKTVKISAYATDYTILGVEHDGSFIPAINIGTYTLARGIDIEKLPSGVMPVIQNHELGRTENALSGMPLAGLNMTPVCDGTLIYHTNLTDGQDNYSVRIENSDEIFEADAVVSITWDLFNEITGRPTDEELRSGGAYGNNQDATSGTNIGQRPDQNSSEIVINGPNSSSSSSTENNTTRQNSASFNARESNSANLESEEEYRSWQDSHQSEMMRLLDELDKQSERQEQIRQEQMQATEQAVMNVAGMINQIRDQRQAERAQAKLDQAIFEYEKVVGTIIGNFNLEASAYEEAVRNLNSFINEHGRRLLRGHRESITNLMNSMVDEINNLYEQKNEFIHYNSPNADARMLSNAIETNTYIDFNHLYDNHLAFNQVVNKSGVDWTFERILEDVDENSSSSTLTREMAEIARDLDYDRPSVDSDYSYYSRYLPGEEKDLIDALKNTNDTDYKLELIEAYEDHFSNGSYIDKVKSLKEKIIQDELTKKRELRREYLNKATYHLKKSRSRVAPSRISLLLFFGSLGYTAHMADKADPNYSDKQTELIIGGGASVLFLISHLGFSRASSKNAEAANQYRKKAGELAFSINKLSIGKDKFALGFRIEF